MDLLNFAITASVIAFVVLIVIITSTYKEWKEKILDIREDMLSLKLKSIGWDRENLIKHYHCKKCGISITGRNQIEYMLCVFCQDEEFKRLIEKEKQRGDK